MINAGQPGGNPEKEEAAVFCRETGIDALAPSFGTAHGICKAKPVLDLERVKAIAEKTGLPLVMHGGSGVSPEDYSRRQESPDRSYENFIYGTG